MARVRHIKPGFFTNDILAEAQPLARMLFAGLWTIADREGRLEDRPKRIKAELLPYDDCNADDLLNELAALGFVIRYVADGLHIIQVVNFDKHQRPHDNEQASVLPPLPDDFKPRLQALATKDDSASAFTFNSNSIRTEQEQEQEHTARSAPVRVSYPDDFEQFWREYPSGNGSKKAAYAQWQKLKPDESLRLEIMHGLSLWNRSDRWQRGFVKDSARWLRDQLWANPPPEQPRASPPNGKPTEPKLAPKPAFHLQHDGERA